MPRVSIITPAYNAGRFIAETIDSVAKQTLTDWEHVVVDDGSGDETCSIVRSLAADDARLRLVCQQNGRTCKARNTGFKNSTPGAEYVLFLDHDDILEPDFLSATVGVLDAEINVGVVYTALKLIRGNGSFFDEQEWIQPRRYAPCGLGFRKLDDDTEPVTPLAALMAYHQAIPSATLFRRTVYEQAGGWDEETGRKVYEDKDIMLRCALHGSVYFLNRRLARYRLHETNLSWQPNIGWREHYEHRWTNGEFLTPEQRRLTRNGIAFDRLVTGSLKIADAVYDLRTGRVGPAVIGTLQGIKKLATSPLAHFGA